MGGEEKVHKCSFFGCESVFSRPYRLAQHLLAHQNLKLFCCAEENCSKAYTNKTHLKRHIDNVHYKNSNNVIYSCPLCMKTLSNRQNLKRHLKIHEKQSLACDVCKKTFVKKSMLQAHIYKHTGVKEFSCDLCPREFITNYEKNKHMKHHKIYSCDVCDLKFEHWSKMQKHQKSEHGPTEFICNECGRKFKKRAHIVRHLKIHTRNIIYKCPYRGCERSYTSISNFNQHYSVKHDNFGYVCTICEKKLSTKAKLRLHHEKIHNTPKTEKTPAPKTLATGRKQRKDIGIYKSITALKLSGLLSGNLKSPDSSDGISNSVPTMSSIKLTE